MAVIKEEKLQEHAKEVGDYFLIRLKKLQQKHMPIGDVRLVSSFVSLIFFADFFHTSIEEEVCSWELKLSQTETNVYRTGLRQGRLLRSKWYCKVYKKVMFHRAIESFLRMCTAHKIILSCEGPEENVIKIKPPMCFSKQDADRVVDKMDLSLTKVMSSRKLLPSVEEGMTK